MLDELSTGWSRFSVDLIPSLRRAIFSRGFPTPTSTTTARTRRCVCSLENHPAVLLFSHRSYLDGVIVPVAMQRKKLAPCAHIRGYQLGFGFMGRLMRHCGVIFLRRKLDDPLYKYVLPQFVGYIVEKRFNLSWSIEGTRSRSREDSNPRFNYTRTRRRRLISTAAALRHSACSRCRSASTNCTRPRSMRRTRRAARRHRGSVTNLGEQLHQGAG